MKKSTIQRLNVVLFWYMNDWGKYGRAYEKIAENLSNQDVIHRVMCVLPPSRARRRYRVFPFVFNNISKKLIVLTPNLRVIPSRLGSGQFQKRINEIYPLIFLKKFQKLFSFRKDNTVLWVFPPHPYMENLKNWIPRRALITQIVDNNTHKEHEPTGNIDSIKKQYDAFAKESDIVITSSILNFEYFSNLNPNCYLFENAVDPSFLGDPSDFPYRVKKTRPRLGYTGWISQRTDINLLGHLAKIRPEYDFIIAGPIEIPQTEFLKIMLPNVRYEGIIPYDKMPDFLNGLDICLIPHHDTAFSRSMSPLKMFQYLASGRPIVSTKVAGVDRWNRLISIAENYDDFVSKIDETIQNDTIENSRERLKAARLETWDKRVKDMVDTILEVINR